jgi:hypothetical protein
VPPCWGGAPPFPPPCGMTADSAAWTFDSDRFRALASDAAMLVGPPLPLDCCPGVPVGRADCIALWSALVDTPSFVASVFKVAESKPGPAPLLLGGAAVVEPLAFCCAGACADALLLVVVLEDDDPQPATAPPNRAVVPTMTAILRMRVLFMSITIGPPPERALGRR